jgi:hypothetical protein
MTVFTSPSETSEMHCNELLITTIHDEVVDDMEQRFRGVLWHETSSDSLTYSPLPDHAVHENISFLVAVRQELLGSIPQNTDGIDVDRVKGFFRSLGLACRPFILFDERYLPTYDSIMSRHGLKGYPAPKDETETVGAYNQSIELAVIPRFAAFERVYGNGSTELTLVHELGHGTNQWNLWSFKEKSGVMGMRHRRIGNRLMKITATGAMLNTNEYLEEGFAAELEAMYADLAGLQYETGTIPSIARRGLHRLFGLCPDLYPAMIRARSDVQGLRDTAKSIESIHSGLYSDIRHVPYDLSDFTDMTDRILRIPAQLAA